MKQLLIHSCPCRLDTMQLTMVMATMIQTCTKSRANTFFKVWGACLIWEAAEFSPLFQLSSTPELRNQTLVQGTQGLFTWQISKATSAGINPQIIN